MQKPEILFLKQEDVIAAGLLDMKNILKVAEDTFYMLGQGKVLQPSKIFMGIPDDENWTSYAMSMPSYIGGDYDVAGFKWAAESVYNATQPGMPYGIDIVILSDPKTMFPKAILDGTITTAMRTSATAGVFAKHTARKDSKIAAFIGAGVIGRTMIMAMTESVPGLEEIRIVDLDVEKARKLSEEFKVRCDIIPYGDTRAAVKNADLTVTETTSRKDFIPGDWLKENATVIQMEAHSFDKEVILSADKIILDSWDQMIHIEGHAIAALHKAGKLGRDAVFQLQEVVTGAAPGRQSNDDFIFCGSYGMGSLDIAVAHDIYTKAKALGIGQELTLWDHPLWV